MSNSDFVRGECSHCASHLEFPASAIGQAVPCPHCGQPTVLAATTPGNPTGATGASTARAEVRAGLAHAPPTPISGNQAGATKASGRMWVMVGWAICIAGLAGAFYWKQRGNRDGATEAKVALPAQPNTPAVAAAPPVAPEPQPEETTNEFAIMPFKLEKTPGSSLVYVIGSVRNLGDQQRFGVKIEFNLFDANDNPVGSATDYQSMVDPHGEWHFRALVMASKTVSARFNYIAEDK